MMKLKKLGALLLAAVLVTSIPTNAFAANKWTAEVESSYSYWSRSWNDGEETGEWILSHTSKSKYNNKGRYEGYESTSRRYVGWDETTYESIYENVTSSSKYAFDKKGRTKSITWTEDGVVTEVTKNFKYDKNGNEISSATFGGNGEKLYTTKISYDAKGYPTQVKDVWANGKNKSVVKYKNGQTVSQVSYYETGAKSHESKFDAKGYCTKSVSYNTEGKVTYTSTYKNTYSGNVRTKCVEKYKSGDDYSSETVTTYYTSGAKLGHEKTRKSVNSYNGTTETNEYKFTYTVKGGKVIEKLVQVKYDRDKDFVNDYKYTYKYKTFKY